MLLNLRELFTAGIAVHKFSICFVCTDQWASGQQCMEVRKAIISDWNVTRMKRKLTIRHDHRIKTVQPNINDLGIILFRRQCLIWWNQNMLYFSNIKLTKIERSDFFGGTPGPVSERVAINRKLWLIASSTWFTIKLRLISIVRLIANLCETGPRYDGGPTYTLWCSAVLKTNKFLKLSSFKERVNITACISHYIYKSFRIVSLSLFFSRSASKILTPSYSTRFLVNLYRNKK